MYQLNPPIFIVPEGTNFPDSWELFCCKLLNIDNKTSEIHRRLPPEKGVDLFYPTKKIAYQCKSVETGLTSGFNLTAIKNSYESALTIKSSLGWTKYVVCINTALTGNQHSNFQTELPGVEILINSYWTTLCQKNPTIVQENFRKIIPVPPIKVEERIEEGFVSHYSTKLKQLLCADSFDLLFYSNRHSSVYRIPVSKEFQVKDLLHILIGIFDLPKPTKFDNGIEVSLSYSIVHDNKKISLNQTIDEAGLTSNSIITFWLTMTYSDGSKEVSSTTMQMMTVESIRRALNPVEYALADYKVMISLAFDSVDKNFLEQ